jgi:hypothetical protein
MRLITHLLRPLNSCMLVTEPLAQGDQTSQALSLVPHGLVTRPEQRISLLDLLP